MKYQRMEDLPVWNAAVELGAKMIDWTDAAEFRGAGDLADQLQRAALSISNNIAEGFERGTTKELIHFLYYAKGSAGEVRSMLAVMKRATRFVKHAVEVDRITASVESISRQLNGWTQSLQNSDIAGPKFLTDASREEFERKKSQQRFLDERRRWKEEFERKVLADRQQENEKKRQEGS
jgi:four helix bundle protein